MPELQLLSNGTYHLRVMASGHGASCWEGLAVMRWCEDATRDSGGTRLLVRVDAAPDAGSTAAQRAWLPSGTSGHDFHDGRAIVWWRDEDLEMRSELAVSVDDAVELRHVVFTNTCTRRLSLSATSYGEIVLCPPATDSAHPAFNKLFVETEIDPALQAILATRRPSTPADPTPWLLHTALTSGAPAGAVSFETDRKRFIGRGRDADHPQALDDGAALSGTAGAVLDAVAAIRVPFVLEPGAAITIDWFTGVAATRATCVALLRKVRCAGAAKQILEQGGNYRSTVLRTLAASDADARIGQRMAASILTATAALRAGAGVIEKNSRGQSDLWRFGISGDLPIVLLQLSGPAPSAIAQQMVRLHAYWHAFGLGSELAILCATSASGVTGLFDQVRQQLESGPGALLAGKPGGIFVLDDATLEVGDRILLQSAARIVVSDADTLDQQLARFQIEAGRTAFDPFAATPTPECMEQAPPGDLVASNGFGGFTPDGREYVITTSAQRMTPAPWVNVIANPDFGTLVSESGSATTWSENAHEFRLTPWSNDPVRDPHTEALYIRDEASGHYWSPTLLPTRAAGNYTTRH
ncbi:MAG: cyclic beta 1-2 glucan synthetase, partial [Betaproteobacteria bacterium]